MSLDQNINLGWHFYRNYFVEENNNGNITPLNLTKQNLETDATEKKFKAKNKEITDTTYDISYFSNSKADFHLYTTYPGLLLGSGYGHEVSAKGEFKLGFFFDYTTGLPIIPGSSIKGVLRSVFPDFEEIKNKKENDFPYKLKKDIDKVRVAWILALLENINKENFLKEHFNPKKLEDVKEEETQKIMLLTLEIFEGVKDYSKNNNDEKYYSIYERDIFHDATIKKANNKNLIVGDDYITPHIREDKSYEQSMLLNPNPIPFLKVLPNIAFQFNFDLKVSKVYPALEADKKELLFKKILLTIGVGAKTNVGYGQFSEKPLPITTGNNEEEFEETQTPINTDIIPMDIQNQMKAGTVWETEVIEIANKNKVYLKLVINKITILLTKKKEKFKSDVKVGDTVKIKFIKDFELPNPNFQIS